MTDIKPCRKDHAGPCFEDPALCAAILRTPNEDVWDECAQEAFDRGLIHDAAQDELKGRNPYRHGLAADDAPEAVDVNWGARPTPKYVEVCSMCGQRWEGHTRYDEEGQPLRADLTDCIRVLKNANRGPMGPAGPAGPQGFPGVVPS